MKIKLILMSLYFAIATVYAQTGTNNKTTSNDNKTYTIDSSDLSKTIELSGENVVVSGNNNKIQINGEVKTLTISGENNEIDVESAKAIVITGDYNFVSWKKSNNTSGKPTISDKGGYNNVGKKASDALDKQQN
ncbi:MAG: DUF3060 domain-containing protein [Chitinophagales bacterium]|nr:DUF3060 domain-containing protein [Bacteroidota bacterium]